MILVHRREGLDRTSDKNEALEMPLRGAYTCGAGATKSKMFRSY